MSDQPAVTDLPIPHEDAIVTDSLGNVVDPSTIPPTNSDPAEPDDVPDVTVDQGTESQVEGA